MHTASLGGTKASGLRAWRGHHIELSTALVAWADELATLLRGIACVPLRTESPKTLKRRATATKHALADLMHPKPYKP